MLVDRIFQKVLVKIRNGARMHANRLAKSKLEKIYKEFVDKGDLVFDVGANIGFNSCIFQGLGAKVITLEPNPYLISVIKENTLGDTVILNKGVGSKVGVEKLFLCKDNDASSSFSEEYIRSNPFKTRRWDNQVDVPMTTLDSLIAEYGKPRFIKIDVEGYEPEVLRGLSGRVPGLSFEFISSMTENAEECIKLLDSLGNPKYNFYWGETYRFYFKNWVNSKQLINSLKKNHPIYYSGDIFVKF